MDYLYLLATLLFVAGIQGLTGVRTARRGNQIAAIGMLVAVIAVLVSGGHLTWWMVVLGIAIGGGVGYVLAMRVPLTAMPELVAAFNGLGGIASTFVALAYLTSRAVSLAEGQALMDIDGLAQAITLPITVLIGTVTLTGSLVAYYKLAGKKMVHPFKGVTRHYVNVGLGIVIIVVSLWLVLWATTGMSMTTASVILTVAAGILGVFLVLPIGGADMPVVVALLNSYSGIAASASGFIINNPLLVVAGALVGASGLILTRIMCKAMNRSLANVLLGGIGDDATAEDAREYEHIKETTPEEVAMLFDDASSVIMVPGYGLAVAQAQHTMRELGELLEKRGVNVRYAIHPVAGRMPGHMNVLLAEADVSYDKLFELDKINGDFSNLDVDLAQTVVVVKRSLSPGYAGIRNPLFDKANCLMCFMDAKEALQGFVTEVKAL